MTTETHLNMHAQACIHINLCTHRTHTCNVCNNETHPPSVPGVAHDKQPWCEVYLSRQCTVSVWGYSEWGIGMVCRHCTAVQVDFAKAACPQISTSVTQHPRHLSTSLSGRWEPSEMSCTAESSLNWWHIHAGLTHQGWRFKLFYQFNLFYSS